MRPGAAESGEHFVGDQQRSVSVAQAAHAGQKLGGPHDHPARGLQHRLDEHAGDRVTAFAEALLQVAQAIDLAAVPRRVPPDSDSSTARERAPRETAAAEGIA